VLAYDRLVIATGAIPAHPPVTGLDLPGVFPLHTMEDSFRVHAFLEEQQPRSAVIIGGGYIGVEMADALTHRGIDVTLTQHGPSVLATIDPSMGELVTDEVRRHDVTVVTSVGVETIERAGGHLTVTGRQQMPAHPLGAHVARANADLVLVTAGVRPQTELARLAGVTTGGQATRSAITVTRAMDTNVDGIYAAGDCVETWHRLLERPAYLPLGTTAHKQGRIAGANAAVDLAGTGDMSNGGRPHRWRFAGTLGTQVVKVFDVVVARTGLLDAESRAAGFDPVTVESIAPDHKRYYPGASELHLSITGDRRDGRLLGAQIVGQWHTEVAKRIDIFATALFRGMRVDELNDLDLSYTPPVSSPWDPIQMAGQSWTSTSALRSY
jgi:NADPH-dependent 2,4-dienoyl-CoA reductase/sulfur reductase-like enzyme